MLAIFLQIFTPSLGSHTKPSVPFPASIGLPPAETVFTTAPGLSPFWLVPAGGCLGTLLLAPLLVDSYSHMYPLCSHLLQFGVVPVHRALCE